MGAATSAQPRVLAGFGFLRDSERALVVTAGLVFALASAGATMSGAAADAMFLSELGPKHLGEAVAVSSALLAVVLAVVGGLADRLDRRRVLATLAIVSAVVLAGLAGLSLAAPRAAAVLTLVGGKQLAAATDLAFWVVIAERLDARRSQRLLPILAATGGIGAAAGAALAMPLGPAFGAAGVLLVAAVLLGCAAAGALRLASTRRVVAPRVAISTLLVRSWRDGFRATRRNALARHLVLVVGAAGAFASLAYFALAIAVAGEGGEATLVALFAAVRFTAQALTLYVQLRIAPRLFVKLGTAQTLLLAPVVALAAGVGLVISPLLAVAVATQLAARVFDGGIQTPAEKLAQTLLPTAVRGRVGGFLDGTAKRLGGIIGALVAAVLVGSPTLFYVITAVAAAIWLAAAWRISRELPALAIEHVVHDAEADAVVDARALDVLRRELDGPRPERAAEVLARLHAAGRVDAIPALVRACTDRGNAALWRSLINVLDTPAEAQGAALVAAAKTAADTVLAVRAIGLAGGVAVDELAAWRAAADPGLALAAELAALRLTGDHDAVLATLADAVRDSGPTGRVAVDELVVEIARGLAANAPASPQDDRVALASRHLSRALRRGRGDAQSRAAGFTALARVVAWARDRRNAEWSLLRADLLELARERVESAATPLAPETALTSLMRVPGRSAADDLAPETAAALRMFGALVEGADAVDPEDLRRIARALGEPDDDVRAAAEDALAAIGPAAAGELMVTAAWGRRRARDRAAELLAQLPVTPAALDRLIDAELDALEQTHAAIAVLVDPGDDMLARRLDERMREIAHTVLLLVAARRRSPAIARAAAAWSHARGGLERARTLAVVEAALPRALVARLVDAVDDLTPADRAASIQRAGAEPANRDAVIRVELAGRDRLARALALHTIGAAGRSAHRDTIAKAAHTEAQSANPAELLRKLTAGLTEEPVEEEGASDMPSRVESLIALGRVPLLAALTTRQLADLAERARWVTARQGGVVLTAGDQLDALIVVEDGELELGDRRIVKGDVVDELACVAPTTLDRDLRAVRAARLIRLERMDFEELVDDVPGLAAAVCRALGERARRAETANYRSPLITR